MIKFVKNLNFFATVVVLYFFSRLINLLVIPIFTDEAIYSYWAQIALHDPANRFMSLEDGKQPLFIWLGAVAQRLIKDPLIAMRLVSVFAGFGSLVGIYFLTDELFGKKVARISSLLYIILPFTLLYDRLALFDSLLTMFCIWAVFLSVKMAKKPALDMALLNGIVLGLGQITKSSASLFLYLLPLSLFIFDFEKTRTKSNLVKWAGLSLLSVFISQVIYNFLRVSPLFYMINRKNSEFIRSFSQVAKDPLAHFSGNLNSMLTWLFQYNGPLLVLPIIALFYGVFKKDKKIILLAGYVFIPFVTETFFNQILYPRFLLFYFPFVIILMAFSVTLILTWFKKYKHFAWILPVVLLIYPVVESFQLVTKPTAANIADSDKFQYINGWSSGYGVPQIADFLKFQSKNEKVYVGTEGTFGLLPFALQIYFYGNPNIQVAGYWPVDNLPEQVLSSAKIQKTYFIFYQNQELPRTNDMPRLKLIAKYQKGSSNSFMQFYEIIP